MTGVDRYVSFVRRRSRLVIVLVLLSSAFVGYGATMADDGFVIAEFETDSPEADADEYVEENFDTGQETVTTLVVMRDPGGGDALSRDAMLESLSLQEAIAENETVEPTLRDEESTIALANVVADVALAEDAAGPPPSDPSFEDRRDAIETRSDDEIDDLVAEVLEEGETDLLAFVPADYEPGDGTAEAQLLVVTHDRGDPDAEELPPELVDAQLAIDEIATERTADAAGGDRLESFAFGPGIVDERSGQATGESFALVGPIALVLVVSLLAVAYRDVLDVTLGLAGIALVLVWMGGFVGWLGIEFTQILVAVPFLLIGLSIDYALHVVMRYREERAEPGATVDTAMVAGLAGVVVAIGATTVTTSIGFFSNLSSDLASIRDFGLLSGLGILAAFVVFGALLPAVKYELESALEAHGIDRDRRAFGTGGLSSRILGVGAAGARRAPLAIVAIVLVVSLVAAGGAANVETSIDENDFLPEERPTWMESVPEPVQPSDYQLQERARYLDATFGGPGAGTSAGVLITGNVTDPAALEAIDDAAAAANDSETTFRYATGEAAVETPISVVESVAAENETVAAQLERSDESGDGVPDREIEALFDAAFAADEEAMAAVVATDGDGGYEAARIEIGVRGDADGEALLTEVREAAAIADEPDGVDAVATGQPIVLEVVQDAVLETLVTTFTITLVLVGTFLSMLFGRRHGRYSLGVVTMLPVLFALSWILGAMYLLEIPYNSETAIITGIAIGIGVDFAIHITERYVQERDDADEPIGALSATVRGTGGALLASALTTVAGFGILTLTLVPSLQRFGAVTALTIAFAWVASVLVLPSLLVLWDRRIGIGADRSTHE
ncbi:efflux RND transporter permease subunit [Natrarchaeobius oligotrophus]|uniref:Transporter n=1 Tax=Natrarchaeobius chitinivorans TaxID=1679083 RepID=A0A3N6MHD3_NATCH|nr:MMPL family transporter [Natrarchaeobius chitinivorans]RQH02528.1 transporter [Natrarchaeobius chitinivorans]